MKLEQYLSLVDVVGRMLGKEEVGGLAPDLPPILERLKIDGRTWVESILNFFDRRPSLQSVH